MKKATPQEHRRAVQRAAQRLEPEVREAVQRALDGPRRSKTFRFPVAKLATWTERARKAGLTLTAWIEEQCDRVC